MKKQIVPITLWLAGLTLFTGCPDDSEVIFTGDSETVSDTDVDADADTDTDNDTDTDTDADTYPESDPEFNADSDTGSDTDTAPDPESDPEFNADSDTDADPKKDSDPESEVDTGSDPVADPACDSLVSDAHIVITDDTNYSFANNFSIASTIVRDATDLTFNWGGLTHDFFGRPLDPAAAIDLVTISLWNMTTAALAENLSHDYLPLEANLGVLTTYPDGTGTSENLLDFNAFGNAVTGEEIWRYFDTSTPDYAFPPESHTFLVTANTGTDPGTNVRMMALFTLDPNATNTEVLLTDTSTVFDYAVDFSSLKPVAVPEGTADLTIDWGEMTINALGNVYDGTQITEAVVAFYANSTLAELEERFIQLDEQSDIGWSWGVGQQGASFHSDGWWQGEVIAGTRIDLSALQDLNGNAFPGVSSAGVWLAALFCGSCNSPAPWSITLLQACPGVAPETYVPDDCDGPIEFADANLEQLVRSEIGKPEGDIYADDVAGLSVLENYDASLSSLSGIECLTNLTVLGLENGAISDLRPLSGLTNLTQLILTDQLISDITPLSGLTNLTFLNLVGNTVSDLSALSNLSNLTAIELYRNAISDITPLSGLTNLIALALQENAIIDISALSGLTNLIELGLTDNRISDITPLVKNAGIENCSLYIGNNLLDCDDPTTQSNLATLKSYGNLMEQDCN